MQGMKHCKKHKGDKDEQRQFIDLTYIRNDTGKHVEIDTSIQQIIPASKNMLSESKNRGKSWTIILEKFLQQIPHFESFFHIVILLHECLAV